MAALQPQVDSVKAAVTSASTCTPAISALLKELLQTSDTPKEAPKPSARARAATKTQSSARAAATTTTTTSTAKRKTVLTAHDDALPPKERGLLATHVINSTLKALAEAAKSPPREAPAAQPPADASSRSGCAHKTLRRSNSMPMTPLPPRALNRELTSPAHAAKATNPAPLELPPSSGCLATVECARVAFACLRSLQSANLVSLPELQLETGMSSFVNKLLTLRLFDHATRELRILKRRLEAGATTGDTITTTSKGRPGSASEASSTGPKTFCDLLQYPKTTASGQALALIVSAQLQALRIVYGLKKSPHLDAILPFLRRSHDSAPVNLTLRTLAGAKPDESRCARTLENLAQSMLCLTPSVHAKDDGVATEPKLSPSPETSFEVQGLALDIRLSSWSVSGHRGDVEKDVLHPFSKCLDAFTRRSSASAGVKYRYMSEAFDSIQSGIQKLGAASPENSKGPSASIYQALGSAAREAGDNAEAQRWASKIKSSLNPSEDSAAKCCAASAQMLAVSLKRPADLDQGLLAEVSEYLQGSLSGNSTELNDLLAQISLLRKSAFAVLLSAQKAGADSMSLPAGTLPLLENLIFLIPRFALRWLGKPPAAGSSAKDFLRFEQRRQLLSSQLQPLLDSAFLLMKMLHDENRLTWDVADPVLQDSLTLLDYIGETFQTAAKKDPSRSYHVKISHLYYQQHLTFRKEKGSESSCLRALRRSVESIKSRPDAEQHRAQLLPKWERYADLCKAAGRKDDSADALRSIRDHLVRQDLVPTITSMLATTPLHAVWRHSSDIETLSRTVCSLAKLDRKPMDWTWLLDGFDKATALEHDLHFVVSGEAKFHDEAALTSPLVEALLHMFTAEQYPIRRLRTMLQLLSINLSTQTDVSELRSEARALAGTIRPSELGDDVGLGRFLRHLQSMTACMFALLDSDLDSPVLHQALANWKTMVWQCQTAEQLGDCIDDPSLFLTTLGSLADFARVRGKEIFAAEILELTTQVSTVIQQTDPGVLLAQRTTLCLQHLSLGYSSKAESVLERNRELVSTAELPLEAMANFHLSDAEYHVTIGSFDKAEQALGKAHQVASNCPTLQVLRRGCRVDHKVAMARASFLSALLALDRGDSYHALYHAKTAVKSLFHDWHKLEDLRRSVASSDPMVVDQSQDEISQDEASLNSVHSTKTEEARNGAGPEFWALVYPLFRFILRLSVIYAHLGLYQETLYYAEQAQKVAESTESKAYQFQADTWRAQIASMAGKPEQALEIASKSKLSIESLEPTYSNIDAVCQLGRVYRDNDDLATELDLISTARNMLDSLHQKNAGHGASPEEQLEAQMSALSIKKPAATKIPARSTSRATRTARPASKSVSKKPAAKTAKAVAEVPAQRLTEDVQLSFLRAAIIQAQSTSSLTEGQWEAALESLQSGVDLSKLNVSLAQERLLMAMGLIGQSLEQMGRDSVFSVLQESTLSFPSIASPCKDRAERTSLAKSPAASHGRSASRDSHSFTANLRQAQDHLLAAHSIASLAGDGAQIHRIAALMQNVFILLSTTGSSKPAGSGHPAHATCSVEMARNLTWRREKTAIREDAIKPTKTEWPMPLAVDEQEQEQQPQLSRRTSLGFSIDMNRFQRDYVDIIPSSWNVVSVSLSDNRHDLCITKLQAGQTPFAIRLPLGRANSRDADSDVFSFQQGRSELLDIVERANRTCHNARDISEKSAKVAWWDERKALDGRMRDLLVNMEETWLGGFKGVLSPGAHHHHRHDQRRSEMPLARFRKSFINILDKHLPSRQQPTRGKRARAAAAAGQSAAAVAAAAGTGRISLDPRVIDLFVGIGDATAPECDLDEALTDLLYFVVDILQFHGERNAYDEIDFDSMVVEAFDALHAYHSAVKADSHHHDNGGKTADTADNDNTDGDNEDDAPHTILILDKALHVFPWESLPCMAGSAVSRVPSLACLRRAILDQRGPSNGAAASEGGEKDGDHQAQQKQKHYRQGHYASSGSGTYVLNPGGDLSSTQRTFSKPLSALAASANHSQNDDDKQSRTKEKEQRPGAGNSGSGWTAIESRQPTEAEFEAALTGSDLLLYFGHGSGAQYIRGKTVRRLGSGSGVSSSEQQRENAAEPPRPRCRAAALLMGCSSAALEVHGGGAFEPHGPVWNYMLAGCPAVVGTLWDVTDRDIDRYAGRLFEEWGLVARGTFRDEEEEKKKRRRNNNKGLERKPEPQEQAVHDGSQRDDQQTSLVEAVARARDACRFRYLTAAAVCVYGVPVYIEK